MAAISLQHVGKVFESGQPVVKDVSLDIPDGELIVLVGPSGSGKSTLLRLIAGLEPPSSGRILIDGVDVTDTPPQQRDLAMVFQSYALYPHKSVRENLAFGLRMRGRPPAEISRRVAHVASVLQIDTLLDRRPAQLSGGQRQRVALGRAIVREPKAFLFDEPLSNLDPALRLDTRTELALLHRRLGATMIYVTHDQEEAMKLGDRVVVLREGRVEQAAPPLEIYRRPANLFVARFLGSPPMNLLPARTAADGVTFSVEGTTLSLRIPEVRPFTAGDRVLLGVRPEDVLVGRDRGPDLRATIELVEPTGSEMHVHLRTATQPEHRLIAKLSGESDVHVGSDLAVSLRRDRIHVFDAR